jgi:hypothetical protein
MRDWAIFATRSGSGILEGITDAQKGDASWEETKEFLQAIANDGAGLHNREVELKYLTNPAAASLPMPGIVELVNGLYAKCYRGVELATGSRSASGSGQGGGLGGKNPVGASVMSEESGILLARDAKWASGILQERVDRPIIRYLFNQEPRARIVISTPVEDTSADDIAAITALVPLGLPISLSDAYEASGFSPPSPGEPVLQAPVALAPDGNGQVDGSGSPPNPFNPVNPVKTSDPSQEQTQDAAPEGPIAPGARPDSMAQMPDPSKPDPQVDAAGFWSNAAKFFVTAAAATRRAIIGPFSRDSVGALPAAAYAIPNEAQNQQPKVTDKLEESSLDHLAAAEHEDLAHAAAKVKALLQITDPAHFAARAKEVLGEWDDVTGNTLLVPKSADALLLVIGAATAQGLQRAKESTKANEGNEEK